MSYILFDLAILAILALFVWRGAARGFVLTLCGLVAAVVALLGASLLANLLAPKVGQALEPTFAQMIQEQLEESIANTDYTGIAGDVAATPDEVPLGGVLEVLRDMGFYEELIDTVENAVQGGLTQAAAGAAAAVASAIAQSVAYAILFLIGFILILLVWTILSHALDLVTRLPGLHTLNKAGGAVIGLLKGGIILFVAAWVLRFFGGLIPQETVEKTILLKFFLTTNPVTLLTGM